MKRAAEERGRTYLAWKKHHDDHLSEPQGARQREVHCRCDLQVGRFRKGQRHFSCGKTRCYLCHGEKLLGIPTVKDLRHRDMEKVGMIDARR